MSVPDLIGKAWGIPIFVTLSWNGDGGASWSRLDKAILACALAGVLGNNIIIFFFLPKKKKEGRISIKSAIKKIDVYCMGMFSKCDFSNCFSHVLYMCFS